MSAPQSSSTTHTHAPKETSTQTPDTVGQDVQPEAVISNLQPSQHLNARYVAQLQRQMGNRATQRLIARKPQQAVNQTGLPDALKSQVEASSGLSLDDVRVHHDSDKPAELHAQAYTQGAEIHVAPGAGEHLAHEAWHVVQQKQGRVSPTTDIRDAPVNDEVGLEQEAESFAAGKLPEIASVGASAAGQPIARAPIQFYDPKGVASFFDRETIPELKVHIGEDTFTYFVKQTPLAFKNIMPFFQNQRLDTNAAIVNAEAQGEFLKAHADSPANLQLAKMILRDRLDYNPTRGEVIFGLLQPYYNTPRYGYFDAILTRHANDAVAAGPEFVFMGQHLASDEEFALADECLTKVGYNTVTAAPLYTYLAKYTAMGESQLKAAKRILASKGDDPMVAEQTMTATKDYGYSESVAQGAKTMTNATAEADIQEQLSEQAIKRATFEKQYTQKTGVKLSEALTRNSVKGSKKTAFGNVLGVDNSLADGTFRDEAEASRRDKVKEFDDAPGEIEGERGNLEAKYGLEIKNALTPLYAFDEAEAAANACMTMAGTDVELLKKYVAWVVVGLAAKIALITLQNTIPAIKALGLDEGKTVIKHHGAYLKLAGLSAEKAFRVIQILATGAGSDGDLSATETERLLGLLAPLTGDKIHALIVLLEPSLISSGMLDIATKLKVNGTKLDAFVRKYVPGITAKLLLQLVNNLAPLTDTGINDFVALLHPSLAHDKVVDLTEKLLPLDGTQQKAFIPKLQTAIDPLVGKQIAELVNAMEGTPGDKMDTMVTQFTALGDNTGKKIAKRVSDMRGGNLKTTGNSGKDITELQGERLLTGDEISIRADQVTTGTLTSADLMKYPHSNINPVGRDEDLLWKDCDPTVSRHVDEKAADLEIRKKLAFNQICKIGGVDKEVAQQVVMENDGQKPRDMDDASTEDGRSGGHTSDRHVIGSGQINTLTKLQNRADGVGGLPPCPGRAGAYANMGASQTGMQNAMKSAYNANLWPDIRKQLIRKLEYDIRRSVTVSGHVARNAQPMRNNPSGVYLPVKGENVKGGFSTFHNWPEL